MRASDQIVVAVARAYDVEVADIRSERRINGIAQARQVAYLMTSRLLGWSYSRIGQAFGRDHTTIKHGCEAAAARAESSEVDARRVRRALQIYVSNYMAA